MAVAQQQLFVRAGLDNPALFQHDHQIGPAQRAQPVGDDERRGRPRIAVSIAARISCSVPGSIEANASSRIRIGGSSSIARAMRQPLPLAAREVRAVFADDRVVAVGQFADEIVGRGDPGGRVRSRRGVASGLPKAMFAATVLLNKKAFLKHQADAAAQVVRAPAGERRRRRSARGRPSAS